MQNYPNPFNPSTNIEYVVSRRSNISIKIFDLTGKELFELVNSIHSPGRYKVVLDGANLPSGVYLCSMKAGDEVETRKVVLEK